MKGNLKRGLLLSIIYIALIINYRFIIAIHFDYLGFHTQYFSIYKLFIASILVFIMICLSLFIRNKFYSIVYTISLTLLFFGQTIFYVYNNSNFILAIYMAIPLLLIYIIDKIDRGNKNRLKSIKVNLKDKLTYITLVIVTIILIAPYLQNITNINFKNLLFIDVYETRAANNSTNFLMGYIFSPLSRVLLPFLLIYSINNKKRVLATFSVISILLIFLLNGALKSILIGFIASLFFLRGDYVKKNLTFLFAILAAFTISIIQYILADSYLIADYIRRIFLTPSRLFQVYYDYFNGNFTFYKHSNVAEILGQNEYDFFIPQFIGENVIGLKGLYANVGIFTEGFFSLGTLGVFLSSCIFAFIVYVIKQLNLHPSYFGIMFSYLYIVNTSFFETLLFTHGLLFYILFAYLFIPTSNRMLNRLE
ncbi:MAG: O-antigen polymerase [Bacillota bacterium]